MSTAPVPFKAGDELGSYRLIRPLSSGGFGQVWIGQHLHLDDYRAIKIVPRGPLSKIEQEGIRNYRRLIAPGLLPIWEFGSVPGRCYYAMPLADDAGGTMLFPSVDAYEAMTLEKYREIHRPLPIDRLIAVLLDLLPALQAVHEQGYIHCDIKPANVVRVGGTWRLCDVGLLVRGDSTPARSGTPWYMPPSGPTNNRVADIYALGRTLYRLATEYGPDPAKYEEFRRGNVGLSGTDDRRHGLAAVIRKACEPEPGDRYQTAVEMCGAVEPLVRRTRITIVLEENFDSFNDPRRNEVVACLREQGFCVCTPPAFERGSVRVTVEHSPDQIQRLEVLAPTGSLGPFKTSQVTWQEPEPGFQFELSLVASGTVPALEDFERYVLAPVRAEAARGPAVGFRVRQEMIDVPLALGSQVWTGTLTFTIDGEDGLRPLCQGLWIGVRDLLGHRAEPFELEIRVGTQTARLKSEDLKALGHVPGREAEALERLLVAAVETLRRFS